MFKNYLLISFRNLLRDKFYTLINVFGLALGITSSLLIMIYITDELSYDTFHSKAERTYRLNEFMDTERSSSMPFPFGPTLADDYSTIVESQVRIYNFQSPTLLLENKETNKRFNEPRIFFVDSTFFDVFDGYQLINGNKETALDLPASILITESMAQKYFGNASPIGKILKFQTNQDLIVRGVMPDTPLNAHFQFDFLVSLSTAKQQYNGTLPRSWYWNPCWTYLVLQKGHSSKELDAIFPEFIDKYFPDFIKKEAKVSLQALTDIHLYSDLDFEIQANSNANNIYVFSIIGLLILFIASFNYMNLSTAKSVQRSREVGIRKTMGGRRGQLILQFLTESNILTLISVLISLILFWLSLPAFNSFAEKSIPFHYLLEPGVLYGLVIIILFIGIGSGIYPALVLSSFSPIQGLKGQDKKGLGSGLRKMLVVLQFSISIFMIIGTIVASTQLEFLRKSELGFDKEQVLYVSALRSPIAKNYEAFKSEVERQTEVETMTAVIDALGARYQGDNFRFEGMESGRLFSVFWVRHDFFKTFGLEIAQGRSFKKHITSDDTTALVVNEALCKQMGWTNEEAVGKRYQYNRHNGKIVGVVKDFNFKSKHSDIGPLVIQLRTNPQAFNLFIKYLAIKLNTQDLSKTLGFLEEKWTQFAPGRPFDYFFLNDELDKLYKDENKLSKVAGLFSTLAIVVACLGLFALAAFTAEQRKKEIAVRKVIGGSVPQIIILLSKDFAKLIFIAFVIACPVGWVSINKWLQDFAYRVDLNPLVFAFAGLATLVIALLTISFQSFKAASANPSEVLKYE